MLRGPRALALGGGGGGGAGGAGEAEGEGGLAGQDLAGPEHHAGQKDVEGAESARARVGEVKNGEERGGEDPGKHDGAPWSSPDAVQPLCEVRQLVAAADELLVEADADEEDYRGQGGRAEGSRARRCARAR